MHNLDDPANSISRELAESNELLGKQCSGCLRALTYNYFDKDSSSKDGRADLCPSCQNSPKLSLAEHTARLREMNFNSEAVKRQRFECQEDYKNDAARIGRPMHSSDLITTLKGVIPSLFVIEGNIKDELAIYLTYPCPQQRLNGRDFEYLFFCPEGLMPEYSIYEWDEVRDIPIKEKMRGWRTVLIRLIKRGLISEEQCNKIFGEARGPASTVWHRTLWKMRNK